MIKTALKIYKKNIWDIFATAGIIAIGVLIAIMVAGPTIYSLLNNNIKKMISAATQVASSGFNATAFLDSIERQFGGLNWQDPFNSFRSLLDVNCFVRMFTNALMESGFQAETVKILESTINSCADALVAGAKEQIIVMMTCIGVTCLIGFIASRLVIQFRTIQLKDNRKKSVGRFFALFFLNLFTVILTYTLIILCLLGNMPIAGFIFAMIGIIGMLLVLTFLWPIVCYKNPKLKFKTVFNIKTFGWYCASAGIVLAISIVALVIIFLISDIIGLILVLPVVFITNIIIENIVMAYNSDYFTIVRRRNEMLRKNKRA